MAEKTSTAKFLLIGLLVALVVLLITAAFNFKANRWGIYADDYQTFHGRARPNQLWLKTAYLTKEKPDIDCLLFGSSRVAAIDTRKLEGKCFNFTHPGGLLKNHLESLRYLLDAGLDLNRVYIGLDDITYHWSPEENELHLQRRSYPRNVAEWVEAQVMYLLQPIELKSLSAVFGSNTRVVQPRHITHPEDDWERIRDESEILLRQPDLQNETFRSLRGTIELEDYRGAQAARHLEKILDLARRNQIEVVVFFNPLHYKTYFERNYKRYLDFKQRVAALVDFYDFTGLNAFTSANIYWKETSHYSTYVGDSIAARLVGGPEAESGYGRLVDARNLDHLERRQRKFDMEWLPAVIKNEGVMHLPARYVANWRHNEQLVPVALKMPPGESDDFLIKGGEYVIRREDEEKRYKPGVWTRLKRDSLFLIEYQVRAQESGRLYFNVRQDTDTYGAEWLGKLVKLKPGDNRGYIAGYVSRGRPPIRVLYDRKASHHYWQPVSLFEVTPAQAGAQ